MTSSNKSIRSGDAAIGNVEQRAADGEIAGPTTCGTLA
jgi:hypothetical protein